MFFKRKIDYATVSVADIQTMFDDNDLLNIALKSFDKAVRITALEKISNLKHLMTFKKKCFDEGFSDLVDRLIRKIETRELANEQAPGVIDWLELMENPGSVNTGNNDYYYREGIKLLPKIDTIGNHEILKLIIQKAKTVSSRLNGWMVGNAADEMLALARMLLLKYEQKLAMAYKIKRGDVISMEAVYQKTGEPNPPSRVFSNFSLLEIKETEKNAYEILVSSFYKCIKLVKPGVRLSYIDRVVRDCIIQTGYGDFGYWVHDEPLFWVLDGDDLVWRCPDDYWKFELRQGHCLNIEPSIKKDSLNAILIKKRNNETVAHLGMIKIGATILVASDGYDMIGNGPSTELKIGGNE